LNFILVQQQGKTVAVVSVQDIVALFKLQKIREATNVQSQRDHATGAGADVSTKTVGDLYVLMQVIETKLSLACDEIKKLNMKMKAKDKDHVVNDAECDRLISSLKRDVSNMNKRTADKMHEGGAAGNEVGEGSAPRVQRVCLTRRDCDMPKHIFNNGASNAWGWKKVIDTKKYSKSGFSTMEQAVQALANFLSARNSTRHVDASVE
jgi:hypothetical protein